MEYDYVGAPWTNGEVGNGGLSLRRKSKMLEIIDKIQYIRQAEDYYFSVGVPDEINLKKPAYELAKNFSVETVYNDCSFGIHQVWKTLNENNYNKLIKIYPEVHELKKLQYTHS